MLKLKNIFILLVYLFLFLFFDFCQAATLYLEPANGEYQPGDTFLVEIRIDTEGECINTIEANLTFSQDILKAIDFSQGNSILTLWVKLPEINQEKGEISFSGGIPSGYCGMLPGDPGESNLLGKIILKVKEISGGQSSAEIGFLDSSQVLLNDGLGTSAKLTLKGANFTILPQIAETSKDEWLKEIIEDTIPPEPFEIEIHQDPAIFEGKYFIIFSTTDKQTGIDYYEIKEGKRDWQKTVSPYLLKDQSFKSIIKVKAMDKAGNERVAEYTPEKSFPYWIIILILAGIGIIWWIIQRFNLWKKLTKKSGSVSV